MTALSRPVDFYRGKLDDVQASAPRRWFWMLRPLGFLLVIASMISIMTAGRLTLLLVLDACVAWSFVPLLHILAAAGSARMLGGGSVGTRDAIDLYCIGLGPWKLWMVGLCGMALLSPTSGKLWNVSPAWLAGTAAVAFSVSAWVNFGFFRGALRQTTTRALIGMVAVRAWVWGWVMAYFHVSDQLLPRVPWLARLL